MKKLNLLGSSQTNNFYQSMPDFKLSSVGSQKLHSDHAHSSEYSKRTVLKNLSHGIAHSFNASQASKFAIGAK